MSRARVIQVIEVISTRGAGTQGDPMRTVPAYYTFDGKFLAERDQHQEDERIYALREVATLEERLGLVSLKHG